VRHGWIFTGELSRHVGGTFVGALRARARLVQQGFKVACPMSDTPIYTAAVKLLDAVLADPHPIDYIQLKWVDQLAFAIAQANNVYS